MNNDQDWTTWIITTIMAALTTMMGTVIFLAKLIESKYVTEIRELKVEMKDIVAKHIECLEKHHDAELRLARLETQLNKSEMKSMNWSDLIKERLTELEKGKE